MTYEKIKYNNEYNKEKYDRCIFNVPKGKKEVIETHWRTKGYKSLNAYINALVDRDMEEKPEKINNEQANNFTQEEQKLIELYRRADSRGKRKIIGSAELEVEEQDPAGESSASKIG